jgi:hypothetical protein
MDRQLETHAKPPGSDFDAELDAIRVIFAALEPLNREARDRVVSFAFRRLGISVAMEPELSTSGVPPDYSRSAPLCDGSAISRHGYPHPQGWLPRDSRFPGTPGCRAVQAVC